MGHVVNNWWQPDWERLGEINPAVNDRSNWDKFFYPEIAAASDDAIGRAALAKGPCTTETMVAYQEAAGGAWRGVGDLWGAFYYTFILIFVRFAFEKYVGGTLGVHFGLSANTRTPPTDNASLEAEYKAKRGKLDNADGAELDRLSTVSKLSVAQVQRWFRRKKHLHTPTKLTKFKESLWRGTFYTLAVVGGFWTLYDEPSLSLNLAEVQDVWERYPYKPVPQKFLDYYFIKCGFYASLMITSIFYDVKRKDFWEMQLHHATTIFLMGFSYTSAACHHGSLVLLLHDFSDVWLEFAKLFNYVNEKTAWKDVFFGIFAFFFLVCRLILYPQLIYTVYNRSNMDFAHRDWWAMDLFTVLITILVVLHCFWFKTVVQICVNAISGGVVSDIREAEDSEEDGAKDTKKAE